MTAVTFDLPAKIQVRDKETGFTGAISTRIQRINGCIQYFIRPRCKDGENKIQDGHYLDLEDIEVVDTNGIPLAPETVAFRFEIGDRVRSRVHGKTGIVTVRRIDANNCISYWYETGETDRDGKIIEFFGFERELELVDKGFNKPATG
jgi:hypothetical protein